MAIKQKLASFDASEVVMTFGEVNVDGLADGTFVEAVQENDDWTDVAGASGEVMRSKTNDRRFEVTFTLMQSSDAIGRLSDLRNLDLKTQNGDGIRPCRIYDKASGTELFAATAWIRKASDTAFGKEHTDRVWVIRTNFMELNQRGIAAV